MRAVVEQIKWAVQLQMRDLPPCGLVGPDDDPARWGEEIDEYVAIAAYSQQLASPAAEDRLAAVHALAWLRDQRAISPLLRALSDAEAEVRRAAIRGLGTLAALPEWVLEPARNALADPDTHVRVAAAKTLAAVEGCRPTFLVGALEDTAGAVRRAALTALQELGQRAIIDPNIAAVIAPLMDDADVRTAYAAYWALAYHGGAAWEGQRADFRWSDHGQRVWDAITGR